MTNQQAPIRYTRHDNGAVVLELNRPAKLNAMSRDLVDQLFESLAELDADRAVRTLIITGAGDRAFCVGADLEERRGMSEQDVYRTVRRLRALTTTIAQFSKPVIAAINGYALGGGFEMALACDILIAAENAVVGLTETRLGIIPGAGGTQRLTRLVGPAMAKRMVFTAERLNAQTALERGIVSDVVMQGALVDAAVELAGRIAKSAPLAIREAKFAIDRGAEVDLDSGLAIESRCYDVLIPTRDRVEALEAFREKRDPEFRGE